MARSAVDNSTLRRWQSLDAAVVLQALSDYIKADQEYTPLLNEASTRWHASVAGHDYEILCTGPKFLDTRAKRGGGGAVDLTMHLTQLPFKQAAALLRAKGL